ncbi:hypothetical protein PIIN_04372 [Serendipita indica DSM 11827]|uniref:Uncharacterized protein n=1 Tax=Serendipita indica (strain DSM 11827) TaxID=1109443 RepID=G4TGI1_SERID|nr:hypothetical protein PIIN_04372 [Serendipita indica DSM 11827]
MVPASRSRRRCRVERACMKKKKTLTALPSQTGRREYITPRGVVAISPQQDDPDPGAYDSVGRAGQVLSVDEEPDGVACGISRCWTIPKVYVARGEMSVEGRPRGGSPLSFKRATGRRQLGVRSLIGHGQYGQLSPHTINDFTACGHMV